MWLLFTTAKIFISNSLIAQAKPKANDRIKPGEEIRKLHNDTAVFKFFKENNKKKYLTVAPSQLEKLTNDQFLERIQYDYTKLCLETKDSIITVEVDGYMISLLPVAVKNGWVHRNVAAREVLQSLIEFNNAKTIHGFFPRSFYRRTGEKVSVDYWTFGKPYDVYGTAVIAASLKYFISSYFNGDNETERKIRFLCKIINDKIDWNFAYNESKRCFTWFKNGENAEVFDGKDLLGLWDETFFIQLLALSDTKWKHGLEGYSNFVSNLRVDTLYGYRFYPTPQIGYAAQTFIWFDLRNYKDSVCINNKLGYFESVRNAVLMQVAYSKVNPKQYPYYGKIWGIGEIHNDKGDIQLEEVFSSLMFEPDSAINCLRNIYKTFKRTGIYSNEGMHGKVNVSNEEVQPLGKSTSWFGFYLPLNVLYIENYRSGLLWKLAQSTPGYIDTFHKAGLKSNIKKQK
jgi:hypothetical protein